MSISSDLLKITGIDSVQTLRHIGAHSIIKFLKEKKSSKLTKNFIKKLIQIEDNVTNHKFSSVARNPMPIERRSIKALELLAYRSALKALREGEVPIACLILSENKIITSEINRTKQLNDCLAHAEILAIQKAQHKLKSPCLKNCTIVISLEPCPMCAGAIYNSSISKVIFSANQDKIHGYSLIDMFNQMRTQSHISVIKGELDLENQALMRSFFKSLRIRFDMNLETC